MSEGRCKALVPDGGRSVNFHQCRRNAVKDGYCKQHHPDTVAKRDEERQLQWEEQQNNSPIRRLARAMEQIKELEAELAPLEGRSVADHLKYQYSLEDKVVRLESIVAVVKELVDDFTIVDHRLRGMLQVSEQEKEQ